MNEYVYTHILVMCLILWPNALIKKQLKGGRINLVLSLMQPHHGGRVKATEAWSSWSQGISSQEKEMSDHAQFICF